MKDSSKLEAFNSRYVNTKDDFCTRLSHSAPVKLKRKENTFKIDGNNNVGYFEDLTETTLWNQQECKIGRPVAMASAYHRREKTDLALHDSKTPYSYSREQTNFSRISSRNTVTPFLITQQQRTKTFWTLNDRRQDRNSTTIRERLKSERSQRRSAKSNRSSERFRGRHILSNDEDAEEERQPNPQV